MTKKTIPLFDPLELEELTGKELLRIDLENRLKAIAIELKALRRLQDIKPDDKALQDTITRKADESAAYQLQLVRMGNL